MHSLSKRLRASFKWRAGVLLVLLFALVPGPPAPGNTVSLTLSGRTAHWRPTVGETLLIHATIADPGNQVSSRKVTFELKNVSAWKGTCMNNGDAQTPDLHFRSKKAQFQTASGTDASGNLSSTLAVTWTQGTRRGTPWIQVVGTEGTPTTYTVAINVLDAGAYGELTAKLTDAAGKEWAGSTITLPQDNNGNDIADGWETTRHRTMTPGQMQKPAPPATPASATGSPLKQEANRKK